LAVLDPSLAISEDFNFKFLRGSMPPDPPLVDSRISPHLKIRSAGPDYWRVPVNEPATKQGREYYFAQKGKKGKFSQRRHSLKYVESSLHEFGLWSYCFVLTRN